MIALGGCGDPLRNVDRLSDVDLAVAEAANIAVEPETERTGGAGFLGRLFGRADTAPEASSPEASYPNGDVTDITGDVEDLPEGALAETTQEDGIEVAAAELTPEPTTDAAARSNERGGLFGFLRRDRDARPATGPDGADPDLADPAKLEEEPAEDVAETEEVTLAAAATEDLVGAEPDAEAAEAEPDQRRGLFGQIREARAENTPRVPTGPDAMRVLPGTLPPYGTVGTNCETSRRDLGRRIVRQSGFEIWDSDPRSTEPRAHYITGFADNCARQFTGALAIVGDVGTHEIVRYSDVNIDQPWSDVDNAYERIKGAVCNVRRRQPCGARLDMLGSKTAFITVYAQFGAGSEWVEILLHDGTVAAVAREGI